MYRLVQINSKDSRVVYREAAGLDYILQGKATCVKR
jgi:hypothetical protein